MVLGWIADHRMALSYEPGFSLVDYRALVLVMPLLPSCECLITRLSSYSDTLNLRIYLLSLAMSQYMLLILNFKT